MVALLLAAVLRPIYRRDRPAEGRSQLGGITQYARKLHRPHARSSNLPAPPPADQLGDVYGRKPLPTAAIFIFIVGSALCGAAQYMVQLVVFLVIQGVGAGLNLPSDSAMVDVSGCCVTAAATRG